MQEPLSLGRLSRGFAKMCRGLNDAELRYELASWRVRIALLNVLRYCVKGGFDRNQSRDERGRWDGNGSNVVVTRKDRTGNPKIDAKTDLLVDLVSEIVTKVGPGSGPLYGMRIHNGSAELVRALDIPGIGRHGVEQSFSAGDLVRYGLDGSVRTDMVLRDGRGPLAPILAVWDIKTGNARLDARRVTDLRENLGIGPDVPIIEIHIRRGISVKSVYLGASRYNGHAV